MLAGDVGIGAFVVSTAPVPILRRLSRQELALNRTVWAIHGGVYGFFALVAVVAAFAFPDTPRDRTLGLALVLAAITAAHLYMRPPAIGTLANHLVIAATYVIPAIGIVTIQPNGIAIIGATFFVAPLTAVRLQDRREIAAHMLVFGAIFLGIAIAGALFDVVNQATQIAMLLLIVGSWVQAFSTLSVLEAAEAQGEELEQLVRRDPVTGLGNRRRLDELLVDEVVKHEMDRKALTVVALDLEGLETFIAREGMSATHDLLGRVATGLVEALPKSAVVTRPTDGEFWVVLPETSAEEAVPSVNAVAAVLADFDLKGWGLKQAVSVATWPDEATDGQVLLHVAAERLRAAAIARDAAAAAEIGGRRGSDAGGATPRRRASDQ